MVPETAESSFMPSRRLTFGLNGENFLGPALIFCLHHEANSFSERHADALSRAIVRAGEAFYAKCLEERFDEFGFHVAGEGPDGYKCHGMQLPAVNPHHRPIQRLQIHLPAHRHIARQLRLQHLDHALHALRPISAQAP